MQIGSSRNRTSSRGLPLRRLAGVLIVAAGALLAGPAEAAKDWRPSGYWRLVVNEELELPVEAAAAGNWLSVGRFWERAPEDRFSVLVPANPGRDFLSYVRRVEEHSTPAPGPVSTTLESAAAVADAAEAAGTPPGGGVEEPLSWSGGLDQMGLVVLDDEAAILANLSCDDPWVRYEEWGGEEAPSHYLFDVVCGRPARPALAEALYFPRDVFQIQRHHRATLRGYAKVLSEEPAARLEIGGHVEEREEVSLAGQRAKAVAKFFAELGIGDGRIETVSFGKERPACTGEGEECWARNRRAKFALGWRHE